MDRPAAVAGNVVVGQVRLARLHQADPVLAASCGDSGDGRTHGVAEQDRAAIAVNGVGPRRIEAVGRVGPLGRGAERLGPATGEVTPADPVTVAALEPYAEPVSPYDAAAHRDAVHPPARDPDSGIACRH